MKKTYISPCMSCLNFGSEHLMDETNFPIKGSIDTDTQLTSEHEIDDLWKDHEDAPTSFSE